MDALQDLGVIIVLAFQQLSPALDGLMLFATFFGKVEFYMLFIPLLYWLVDRKWGFRTFIALLAVDSVSNAFKLFLHQPRPYWVSSDVNLVGGPESSYGIPSSHASNPVTVLGYLAFKVRKSWMWLTAAVMVLLISVSRMVLGVHFPHDILGGWLIGALVLWAFLRWEDALAGWLGGRTIGGLSLLAFLASLVYILLGVAIAAAIAGDPDPSSWAAYAVEARSLDHFVTLAAAFFGSTAGYALMQRKASFETGGHVLTRALRYLLGLAGLVIVLYGLDALFELLHAGELLGYILRYIRYAATTFWVMFGAPWVFLKWKLAEPR